MERHPVCTGSRRAGRMNPCAVTLARRPTHGYLGTTLVVDAFLDVRSLRNVPLLLGLEQYAVRWQHVTSTVLLKASNSLRRGSKKGMLHVICLSECRATKPNVEFIHLSCIELPTPKLLPNTRSPVQGALVSVSSFRTQMSAKPTFC